MTSPSVGPGEGGTCLPVWVSHNKSGAIQDHPLAYNVTMYHSLMVMAKFQRKFCVIVHFSYVIWM